jgi:hypothetical protein
MQPWMMALMIPILALTIPIVVVLTNHQRKMAEILHQNKPLPSGELEAIRQELRDLRMLMHQHTIALDDMRNQQSLGQRDEVQNRLGT